MSAGKFAAITASLLARKGAAQPSAVAEFPKTPILWSSTGRHNERRVDWAAPEPRHPEPQRPEPVRLEPRPEPTSSHQLRFSDADAGVADLASHGEKRHRISLALTAIEHEKLGIVAVKRGVTRHQLMRDALDCYFEKLAVDYRSHCACIAAGGCQNGCSPE